MMETDENPIQILSLPEEMLREILSYVPDQLTVGQVCKKFYEISCSLSTYILEIREDCDEDEEFTIESIYQNVLSSSRKIESVRIFLHNFNKTYHLRKIIQHISENVKEANFFDTNMCMKSFGLLNLMPNLEKLMFSNVHMDVKLKVPRNFKFELHQLRECKISDKFASQCNLEIFDRLPDNVLRKLLLWRIESLGKHFGNQQDLEELNIWTERDDYIVDMKKLKLKSLMFGSHNYERFQYLNVQNELKELIILQQLGQKDLDFIFTQLKMLETLNICLSVINHLDFSKLQNLPHLKELVLSNLYFNDPLKTIKSKTLEKLEVDSVDKETALEVSKNCPNLREFNFESYNEAFLVDEIVNLFPKIDSIFYDEQFKVSEDWTNETVTRLQIYSTENINNMLSVAKSFKNLKSLMINYKISPSTLKSLLVHHPNLKSICLKPEEKNIKIVKKYCKHVESIHVVGTKNEIRKWKEAFKDQLYLKTDMDNDFYQVEYHCLMKKTKQGIESCCNACEVRL